MTTKKYSIEEAAQHLLKVLREAESGQDVYITVEGKPAVKVVPIAADVKQRNPGRLKGKISWAPGAFDPLTDEELNELGFE